MPIRSLHLYAALAEKEAADLGAHQGGAGCEEGQRRQAGQPFEHRCVGSVRPANPDRHRRSVRVRSSADHRSNPKNRRNHLEAITKALNERGIRPARGTRWYASSVGNLLSRANKLAQVL
jgi:hypothetical protein